MRQRIEAFQDRWDVPVIEQYVAADFCHVTSVLQYLRGTPLPIGNRFLEWGSGFGLITMLASRMGFSAIGIEAEPELVQRARDAAVQEQLGGEFCHGNFLPAGGEELSDNPLHPSLNHSPMDAYETIGLELDDFSIVYSYPWPGEDQFHRDVFARFAAPGGLYVQFIGPNDVRVWRKCSGQFS